MLLSLAGIPLTAGFVGKFLVLLAGAGASLWTLVVLVVVNSALGVYYYLRVVVVLYLKAGEVRVAPGTLGDEQRAARLRPVTGLGAAALAILTVALIGLGLFPGPVLEMIRSSCRGGF